MSTYSKPIYKTCVSEFVETPENQLKLVLYIMMTLPALFAEVAASIETVRQGTGVLDDTTVRIWCIMGALFGAFLAMAAMPPLEIDDPALAIRKLGAKFSSSFIVGFMLTPMTFTYLKWEPNINMVFGISGLMSFGGVALLHKLLPVIESKLGVTNDKTKL